MLILYFYTSTSNKVKAKITVPLQGNLEQINDFIGLLHDHSSFYFDRHKIYSYNLPKLLDGINTTLNKLTIYSALVLINSLSTYIFLIYVQSYYQIRISALLLFHSIYLGQHRGIPRSLTRQKQCNIHGGKINKRFLSLILYIVI